MLKTLESSHVGLGEGAWPRALLSTVLMVLGSNVMAEQNRPNVLLILVDDLKPTFGAYGADWVHSPNLDRLAARGMRFDFAYCNQAVCAPSRNNLMLGSRSTSLGIYGLATNFRKSVPDATTLPQYFRQHDYHAAGIGKVFHIGHGNTDDEASWTVPFHPEKVIDYVLPESTDGQLTREEAYFSNRQLSRVKKLPRGAAWERAQVDDDSYSDGRIANEAIRRLRQFKHDSTKFFLAVGFTKPHLPFCAPEKYWALYDDVSIPVPETTNYPTDAPAYAGKPKHGELNQYKPVPQSPPLAPRLQQILRQGYFASLSYMDSQLGRVLDELEQLNMEGNTVVILWGDHGYHLGDHGMWTKHTNYEQANRIPLIIAGPGVQRGTVSDALVETVDIYPTLAGLASLPSLQVPQPMDGQSLVQVLKGEENSVRDHAYHCFPRPANRLGRAIRTHRYRLVEWRQIGSTDEAVYELYDYESDPTETKNVAADHPEVVQVLSEMLAAHPEPIPPGSVNSKNRRLSGGENVRHAQAN